MASRAPHNPKLFSNLYQLARLAQNEKAEGFSGYLEKNPQISRINVLRDWNTVDDIEWRMCFNSNIFADGTLQARVDPHSKHVIIFLPGYYTDAEQVLKEKGHPQYLIDLVAFLGASLVTWTLPLQGNRGENALFLGQGSVLSAEKEYVRILPAFGTSLWRELLGELQFALNNIRRFFGPKKVLHVVGWSMGGGLAYYAPLLENKIASVTAVGSCARLVDLIETGATRNHSYYFYPHNCLPYFDLDDVVFDVVEEGTDIGIICGDKDHGCLKTSIDAIRRRVPERIKSNICVLPNHGHQFSLAIKQSIVSRLAKVFQNTKS